MERRSDRNPSLIYIDKEKTFWIYINGKGVYSYREGQKNAVAVKEADELLAKAEVSDMKECGEGILLVLSNGILVCIDEEKQNIKWTNPDIAEDCREVKNATFDCLSTIVGGRGYSVWRGCGFIAFLGRFGNSVLPERTPTIPYVQWHRINTDVYG